MFNDGITVVVGHAANETYRDAQYDNVEFVDFPEDRLHPMDQVLKGKAIVEEYVKTGKPVNIRTFSPEILQSINLYTKMHHVPLHVLIAETTSITECTDDLDPAFESFCDAFDYLMKLRSDLENPDEPDE